MPKARRQVAVGFNLRKTASISTKSRTGRRRRFKDIAVVPFGAGIQSSRKPRTEVRGYPPRRTDTFAAKANIMTPNPSCSLILAAHGSVTTPCANQPLHDLADRVQASGIFSTVTPAFLYGDPEISNVLDRLPPGGDVVVVPVMTSEGYYSQRVFPRKLAGEQVARSASRFYFNRVGDAS